MLVIMDMEWINNRDNVPCPTQIAAIRVDEDWNVYDCFKALVRPAEMSCLKWEHVAYNGSSPIQFLSAEPASLVFRQLSEWLQDNDILCWWGDIPAATFQEIVFSVTDKEEPHEFRILRPFWKALVRDDRQRKGSPYELAKARRIPVSTLEHASSHDVETIRRLLQKTEIPYSMIENNAEADTVDPAWDQIEIRSRFHYVYDKTSDLVHASYCEKIPEDAELQGYNTIKSCIKKHLVPCECCAEEFLNINSQGKQKIIRNCGYSFVYSLYGDIFHKPECDHVNSIFFPDLRGGVYYKSCIEKGLIPCESCHPTQSAERGVPHIIPKGRNSSTGIHFAKRKLTPTEKNALRRHEAAQKDRARFNSLSDRMSDEEKKDAHLLSRSGYAFWAAVGYATFHERNCPKLAHVSGLRGFARYQDAVRSGYRPCRICKPSSKSDIILSVPIYHRERTDETPDHLDALCEIHGYPHSYEEPYYFLKTPVGKWRLNTETYPVDVYHINLLKTPRAEEYHKQPRLFLSLTDTFRYIQNHDSRLLR